MDAVGTFHELFRVATETRDVDAFAALWAEDPAVTMWGSDLAERAHGIDAVRALGSALVDSPDELRFEWHDVDVYERGYVAWINAAGTVNGSTPYRATAVLVRTPTGWRFHTFNGSIPD
jgi:ketosteroid isomerase-like protein